MEEDPNCPYENTQQVVNEYTRRMSEPSSTKPPSDESIRSDYSITWFGPQTSPRLAEDEKNLQKLLETGKAIDETVRSMRTETKATDKWSELQGLVTRVGTQSQSPKWKE